MPQMKVEAPAKLNLHLQIGDRRPDGYHEIESLFVALAFGDTLYLETLQKPSMLEICVDWQLPEALSAGKTAITPEKNIISRAVSLFRSRTGYEKGLKITVKKRIPLGGGLGGGSSDAAAALLALNRLAFEGKNPMSDAALAEMGASLGSDVPFFLCRGDSVAEVFEAAGKRCGVRKNEGFSTTEYGCPADSLEFHGGKDGFHIKTPCSSVVNSCFHGAAWVSGKGEHLQPLELPEPVRSLSVVLVNPGFSSDTAEAYRLFDVWRSKNALMPPQNAAFLTKSLSGPPENWPFFNDFLTVFKTAAERSSAMSDVFTTYQHIISGLKEQGADFAGLSGSGSTCFGVFSGREKAELARESLLLRWPLVICTFLLAHPVTPWYNNE